MLSENSNVSNQQIIHFFQNDKKKVDFLIIKRKKEICKITQTIVEICSVHFSMTSSSNVFFMIMLVEVK